MRARRVSTSSGAMSHLVTVQPRVACRGTTPPLTNTSATAQVVPRRADKATSCKPAERRRQHPLLVRVLRQRQQRQLQRHQRQLRGRRLRRGERPHQGLVRHRRLDREVLINAGLSHRNLNGNSRANLASSQRPQSNCGGQQCSTESVPRRPRSDWRVVAFQAAPTAQRVGRLFLYRIPLSHSH